MAFLSFLRECLGSRSPIGFEARRRLGDIAAVHAGKVFGPCPLRIWCGYTFYRTFGPAILRVRARRSNLEGPENIAAGTSLPPRSATSAWRSTFSRSTRPQPSFTSQITTCSTYRADSSGVAQQLSPARSAIGYGICEFIQQDMRFAREADQPVGIGGESFR